MCGQNPPRCRLAADVNHLRLTLDVSKFKKLHSLFACYVPGRYSLNNLVSMNELHDNYVEALYQHLFSISKQ